MRATACGRATALLFLLLAAPSCDAQVPPKQVKTAPCTIGSVFAKLQSIKSAPACRVGCTGGKCPPDWMPGTSDKCSAACGKIFEPFWDQCGKMLVESKMGGMKAMGVFYDHCLKSLYPPGSCGTFCNAHTYDCYLKEVQQSCCDEKGRNCNAGNPIPNTCQVGCALVFPSFVETCRDHIKTVQKVDEAKFEVFERKCLKLDSLALVEYALDLQSQGCKINLGTTGGRHRRTQTGTYLTQWMGSKAKRCSWDQIDDYAKEVDTICCGADGSNCRNHKPPSNKCTPGCAISIHSFMKDCGKTLSVVMPNAKDPRRQSLSTFESTCVASVDSKFFLKAIMAAKCPKNVKKPTPHAPVPPPPPGVPPPPPVPGTKGLKLKCGKPACEYQFRGIPGTSVVSLTSSPKFKAFKPDKIVDLTDWHQGSRYFQMAMKGDNLGVMMEGWLLAPKTGTYTFSVNSDDSSEVWIAPKPDSKSGLKKVVWLNGCCRKVNGNVRVKLFKGESYYMRAYIKEGGGGEYGKIGMRVGKREYYPIPIGFFHDPTLAGVENSAGLTGMECTDKDISHLFQVDECQLDQTTMAACEKREYGKIGHVCMGCLRGSKPGHYQSDSCFSVQSMIAAIKKYSKTKCPKETHSCDTDRTKSCWLEVETLVTMGKDPGKDNSATVRALGKCLDQKSMAGETAIYVINGNKCGESHYAKSWSSAAMKWMKTKHFNAKIGTCRHAGFTKPIGKQVVQSTGAPVAPVVYIFTKPPPAAKPDVCGKIGGDGTSCEDCKMVPRGKAKKDSCGICDGTGLSCRVKKGEVGSYLYFESQGTAQGSGWNGCRKAKEVTKIGSGGSVHGPWGNDCKTATLRVPVPPAVERCTVSWRSWYVDSRDNEVDSVYIDGKKVWSQKAHFGCPQLGKSWIAGPKDFPNPWHGGHENEVCMMDVKVEVPCKQTLTLNFRSGIDQSENDEAWAFSDVRVAVKNTQTVAPVKPFACKAPPNVKRGLWSKLSETGKWSATEGGYMNDISTLHCDPGYIGMQGYRRNAAAAVRCSFKNWVAVSGGSVGGDLDWDKYTCVKDPSQIKAATPITTQVSTSLDSQHTTLRLSVRLGNGALNVYSLVGTTSHPIKMPPAYQMKGPGSSNVGGTDPMWFKLRKESRHDSWFTIGLNDGDPRRKLASVGCDFTGWTDKRGFTGDDSGIFFMNPADSAVPKAPGPILLAQLTMKNCHLTGKCPCDEGFDCKTAMVGVAGKTLQGQNWRNDGLKFDLTKAGIHGR